MIIELKNALTRFSKDESGAAMVEYAVALIVITTIGIAAMGIIGDGADSLVGAACADMVAETTATGTC